MLIQPEERTLSNTPESGFSMIEVLVTIIVVAIGLLGLSGLQAKASVMEMESYQRAQALALLDDIGDRILTFRGQMTGLLSEVPVGSKLLVGSGSADSSYNPSSSADCSGSGVSNELCQWALAINGASEQKDKANIGALISPVGCIFSVTPSEVSGATTALAEFYVAVAWQGLVSTAAPTNTYANTCVTAGSYATGSGRVVVKRILVPNLVNPAS